MFVHLFEIFDCGGCNEEGFVVEVVVNFVALLYPWDGVDFHLDMRFVIDENLAYMLK